MKTSKLKTQLLALALGWTLLPPIGAYAAEWQPTNDVEIIVPNAPGGGNDLMARSIAKMLTEEKLAPTPVVIVNKPGGGQAVGVSYAVTNRAGDPHTLVLVSTGTQVTPLTVEGAMGLRDLQPLAMLTLDDFFLVAKPDSKYADAAAMVEAAKAQPLSVSIGIGGATDEMAVRVLEAATGAKFNIVRFGSTGESLTALLGGHVDATTGNPVELLPQIQGKAIRGVGVFRPTRFEMAPDVPTLAEQGIEITPYQAWRGVALTKGVPPEAVAYWEETFRKLGETQAFKDLMTANVSTAQVLTGPELIQYVEAQEAQYKKLLGK